MQVKDDLNLTANSARMVIIIFDMYQVCAEVPFQQKGAVGTPGSQLVLLGASWCSWGPVGAPGGQLVLLGASWCSFVFNIILTINIIYLESIFLYK